MPSYHRAILHGFKTFPIFLRALFLFLSSKFLQCFSGLDSYPQVISKTRKICSFASKLLPNSSSLDFLKFLRVRLILSKFLPNRASREGGGEEMVHKRRDHKHKRSLTILITFPLNLRKRAGRVHSSSPN